MASQFDKITAKFGWMGLATCCASSRASSFLRFFSGNVPVLAKYNLYTTKRSGQRPRSALPRVSSTKQETFTAFAVLLGARGSEPAGSFSLSEWNSLILAAPLKRSPARYSLHTYRLCGSSKNVIEIYAKFGCPRCETCERSLGGLGAKLWR